MPADVDGEVEPRAGDEVEGKSETNSEACAPLSALPSDRIGRQVL